MYYQRLSYPQAYCVHKAYIMSYTAARLLSLPPPPLSLSLPIKQVYAHHQPACK